MGYSARTLEPAYVRPRPACSWQNLSAQPPPNRPTAPLLAIAGVKSWRRVASSCSAVCHRGRPIRPGHRRRRWLPPHRNQSMSPRISRTCRLAIRSLHSIQTPARRSHDGLSTRSTASGTGFAGARNPRSGQRISDARLLGTVCRAKQCTCKTIPPSALFTA